MYREDFLLFFPYSFLYPVSCLASKFELIYYFLLRDAMHGHPCGPLAKHPTMKCMVVPTAGADLLTVSVSLLSELLRCRAADLHRFVTDLVSYLVSSTQPRLTPVTY
jgi:hypothetical protein